MLKKYQEIYYTGDDKAYDEELTQLQMYLERMTECLNNALYHGIGSQDEKWYASVMQFSVNLVDNKVFKTYFRQEKADFKIKAYESMYNKINRSNLDALRRISWKLAKGYFKRSVQLMDKQEYNPAMDAADQAIQFLKRSMESDAFIKENKALVSQHYYERNRFKSKVQYSDLLEELQKQHLRCQSWSEM